MKGYQRRKGQTLGDGEGKEVWHAAVHGVAKSQTHMTGRLNGHNKGERGGRDKLGAEINTHTLLYMRASTYKTDNQEGLCIAQRTLLSIL